jgi:hypothetical protein
VQTATGLNVAEGEAYAAAVANGTTNDGPAPPRAFPVQAQDYATGYLLAFGIIAGLCKTITVSTQFNFYFFCVTLTYLSLRPPRCLNSDLAILTSQNGGCYEVRVSIASVGQWIRSLGRFSREDSFGFGPNAPPLPPRPPKEGPGSKEWEEEWELGKKGLVKRWDELPASKEDANLSSGSANTAHVGGGESAPTSGKSRTMYAISHAAILEKTPVREGVEYGEMAPMGLGKCEAVWL